MKYLVNASVVKKPRSKRKKKKIFNCQICWVKQGNSRAARCTHIAARVQTQLEGRGSQVRFVLMEKRNVRPEWLSITRRGPCCLQPHPKEVGA